MAEKNNHVPYRIQTSKDYLYWCTVTDGSFSDNNLSGRELSDKEQTVKEAALNCLLNYFNGEIDYGDIPPNKNMEDINVSDKAFSKLKEMKKFIEEIEKNRENENSKSD